MRFSWSALAALCFLLSPLGLQAPAARAAGSPAAAPASETARVIVKYKAGSSAMRAQSATTSSARIAQQAAALSQRLHLALTDGPPIGRSAQVVFAKGISSARLAALLSADSEVEYAEPDRTRRAHAVPNDPLYPGGQATATPAAGQWYLRAPTSTNVAAINAEGAWTQTHGTSTVVVAVLDTGIRLEHPDLVGKAYPGYDFVSDATHANDGNGRDADASDPGDWVTSAEVNDPASAFYHCTDPDPNDGSKYLPENSSWHGTQVAGLVGAATHNATGMASVGRNVMILPVRVLGRCNGSDSDIIEGMLYAAGLSSVPNPHPAKVINLSLGSAGACTQPYIDAIGTITAQGVTIVASAGNEGLAVDAPANCPGVIAVAGVRHAGTKVGYSSLGPDAAISAPAGNCVNPSGACLNALLTTTNSGTTTPGGSTYTDAFNASLGTSFSSPLVAGAAALMLSVNPALTPGQIRSGLQSTARPFPPTSSDTALPVCHAPTSTAQAECHCTTSTCGAGLLDASAAVASVTPATTPAVLLSASAANVGIGTAVTLDGSAARAPAGRTVASYQWAITAGNAFATLVPSGATATLTPSAAGTVQATLTVTDSTGQQTAASAVVVASGAPTAVITPFATTLSAGSAVSLDGSLSSASGGRAVPVNVTVGPLVGVSVAKPAPDVMAHW
jgi:serine protease